jgi:hypothetical protein
MNEKQTRLVSFANSVKWIYYPNRANNAPDILKILGGFKNEKKQKRLSMS